MTGRKLFLQLGFVALVLAVSLGGVSARTTFGDGVDEPLANVTDIAIYNVTGLSTSDKEVAGTRLDEGVNKTFLLNHTGDRQYRFSFRIRNDGDSVWSIENGDELFHDGVDSGWTVDKIWYNITTDQDFDGGSFSSGKVSWDTSNGGNLNAGEIMFAKYLVSPSLSSSQLYDQKFQVNDTSNVSGSFDHHELDANKLGWLNVTLENPPNKTVVDQNRTFILNTSITCETGECGAVTANPRHNESSQVDTVIPEDSGDPFFTNSSKTQTCSSDLLQDETCFTSWFVNSTGNIETWHKIDANASSSYDEVEDNSTEDHLVQINKAIIFNLSWNTTKFGTINPGEENNSALGNSDLEYNLTIDDDSNQVDKLWTRATKLTSMDNPGYAVNVSNMSWSNTNDINTETEFQKSYDLVDTDLSPGTKLQFFFWLDMPTGILQGDYNGTMFFKANSTR